MDVSWSTVLHVLPSFEAISQHLGEGSLTYLWVGQKADKEIFLIPGQAKCTVSTIK